MKYNNTYALAVPASLANQYNLKSISELKPIEGIVKAGFTPEFPEREDGYLGIQKLYGIKFPPVKIMQPELRYAAVASGEINLVDAYSTDSEIQRYNLTVLEDDLNLFPPYQGAPLLKKATLEQHPELEDILNQLSGQVSDDEMRKMNYEVAIEKKKAIDVAKEFLERNNLLN